MLVSSQQPVDIPELGLQRPRTWILFQVSIARLPLRFNRFSMIRKEDPDDHPSEQMNWISVVPSLNYGVFHPKLYETAQFIRRHSYTCSNIRLFSLFSLFVFSRLHPEGPSVMHVGYTDNAPVIKPAPGRAPLEQC